MDHRTAIKRIVEIEERFDTNSLLYKGVRIWPIIRFDLWRQLLASPGPDSEENSLFQRYALSLLNFCSVLIQNLKKKLPLRLKHLSAGGLKDVDIVFFSMPDYHTDIIDNKYFDRYVDPLIQLIQGKYTFQKVEIENYKSQITQPRYENTVLLGTFLCRMKTRMKILLRPSYGPIEAFAELQRVVSEVNEGLTLREDLFIKQLTMMDQYRAFFEKKLEVLRPKAVFFACYASINMALIWACKQKGIKTIDIQHGKQGKYHGIWTHWSNVPEGGYEFLPDFFWVWGEESKSNIEKWMPQGSSHKPVVGGNRWLSMWLKDDLSERTNDEKTFLEKVFSYERVILVSLQPLSEPISDILIEAITSSPKSYIWLIRLHPLMKSKKEDITARLLKLSRNVEVDMSTELPLYSLLKHSDFHVTAWSSVCYEALVFKVHSVIIHKKGKTLYNEYIRQGLFSYADSSKDLIDIINKDKSKFKYKEENQYIKTDDSIACQALGTIMQDV